MEEDVGIVINIKAVNAKAVTDLVKQFNQLQKSMDRTTQAGKKMGRQQRELFGNMTRNITGVSMAMNDLRFQMSAVASGVTKATFGVAAAGLKIAADTEEANTRLGFSLTKIEKKYEDVAGKIDEVSLRTTLTRKDITKMVSDLAIQKIDAFDEGLGSLAFTAKDGSRQAITALETLNDAVAFSGKTSKRVLLSVKEAVSEQKIRPGRFLADDLNLSRKELDKWNKALQDAGSNQEAFNVLLKMMADRVGGTSDAIKGTLNFVLQQFDDFRDKIATEVFGPALREVTQFLTELGDELIKLSGGGGLKTIAEAMRQVVAGFMGFARILFLVIKGIVTFVQEFPEVIGLFFAAASAVIAFTAALVGMSAVTGVLLALVSVFTLVAAGLSILTGWGIVLAVVFTKLAVLVATLSAGLVGMGVIALASALKAKGFMDIWERVKLVMAGVTEGIKNMDGKFTHLSLTTARTLDEKGLLGTVKKLLRWWVGMGRAFDAFKARWSTFGPRFQKAIEPAIESLRMFAENLGVDTTSGVTKGMGEFESAGVRAADHLAQAFEGLLISLDRVIGKIETITNLFDFQAQRESAIRRSKEIQEHAAKTGTIALPTGNLMDTLVEPGAVPGHPGTFFATKFVDPKDLSSLSEEERASPLIRTGLANLAREKRRKDGESSPALRRRQNFFDKVNAGDDLSNVPAPLGKGGSVDTGVLDNLSVVRKHRVESLLGTIASTEGTSDPARDEAMSKLAKLIGKELAKALVRVTLKAQIDAESMAKTMDGAANASFEAGN